MEPTKVPRSKTKQLYSFSPLPVKLHLWNCSFSILEKVLGISAELSLLDKENPLQLKNHMMPCSLLESFSLLAQDSVQLSSPEWR